MARLSAPGRWRRSRAAAWLVLATKSNQAVQFGGPTLALMSEAELSRHPRLARLGPDILGDDFDPERRARATAGGRRGARARRRAARPAAARRDRERFQERGLLRRRGRPVAAGSASSTTTSSSASSPRPHGADARRARREGAAGAPGLPARPSCPARAAAAPLGARARATTTAPRTGAGAASAEPSAGKRRRVAVGRTDRSRGAIIARMGGGQRTGRPLLTRVPLFSELSAEELERISRVAVPALVPARACGSSTRATTPTPATSFAAATCGSPASTPTAGRSRSRRSGPGDIFGELAMLDGEARSASVETLSDCELLALPAADVRALLARPPRDHGEARSPR